VLVAVVPGFIASVARFGLDSHLEYLGVLQVLSRKGEAFWYNQGLSGLLHRFIDPASATLEGEFGAPLPPFRAPVYLASTAWGLAVLGVTLLTRSARQWSGQARMIDLCAAVLAATIASPVAWNHHYGIVFPVFAAITPILLGAPRTARFAGLLAATYLAVGCTISWPKPFFLSKWTGLLQSHLLVGGVILLAILLIARRMLPAGNVHDAPQRPAEG
jgi:hypothetical protein